MAERAIGFMEKFFFLREKSIRLLGNFKYAN